jgi:dTDP-4-dehydrorhamnose reductase
MVVETLGFRKNPSPNTLENKGYILKLLITGAGGLFGSRLAELALRKNHEIYSAYRQHLPSYGIPLQLDVSDKNQVENALRKVHPDAVVHAAALTDVDECELNKELAWKINVDGTENIAKSCKKYHAFLIHMSTDYVFNGEKGAYRETDKPDPINNYGLTKLAAEEHVKNLIDEYCIARPSVIYGATPAGGKVNFALWLLNKLKRNDRAKIITDQWNSPTLNTNLANMILEVIARKITGTLHLAGATRVSRYEFSRLLANTFGLNPELIIPVSSRELQWTARRPRDSSLDVSRASELLNEKPLELKHAFEILKEEITS